MKIELVLTVVLLASFQNALAYSSECSNANEVFSDCGNLCEDSCANNCDLSEFQSFSVFNATTNADCEPGCYCKANYIRNDDDECVFNRPVVCSKLKGV